MRSDIRHVFSPLMLTAVLCDGSPLQTENDAQLTRFTQVVWQIKQLNVCLPQNLYIQQICIYLAPSTQQAFLGAGDTAA